MLAVWCNSPAVRWPLCTAASFDEGRTWTRPHELARHKGFQSSYPTCVQTADGTIVTTYYYDRIEADQRYHMGVVRWRAEE